MFFTCVQMPHAGPLFSAAWPAALSLAFHCCLPRATSRHKSAPCSSVQETSTKARQRPPLSAIVSTAAQRAGSAECRFLPPSSCIARRSCPWRPHNTRTSKCTIYAETPHCNINGFFTRKHPAACPHASPWPARTVHTCIHASLQSTSSRQAVYLYIYIIAHMLARDLQEQQSTHACMHPCNSHSAYILCIMYTMYI